MTARQMQMAFEAWFDHAGRDHQIVSDEIFRYLNEAQDEFTDELFTKFEQDQVITDDLRVLVEKDSEVNALYAGPAAAPGSFQADYATIPTDYRYMIAARVEVKYNRSDVTIVAPTINAARTITGSSTTATYLTRLSQSDDIYRLLLDPFNRTMYYDPLGTINGTKLIVYTNSKFICERFFLDYLRIPNQISLTGPVPSEFPDHLHKDIVDRAINRYIQRSSILQPTQTPN